MAGFEQALVKVLYVAIVEGLVFSALVLTTFCMLKAVMDRVFANLRIETAGTALAVHRDTVLDLNENTGDGRPASKPRILTETEAEEAIS